MTFPSYWEYHHPNWRTPSFFRGVGYPSTRKDPRSSQKHFKRTAWIRIYPSRWRHKTPISRQWNMPEASNFNVASHFPPTISIFQEIIFFFVPLSSSLCWMMQPHKNWMLQPYPPRRVKSTPQGSTLPRCLCRWVVRFCGWRLDGIGNIWDIFGEYFEYELKIWILAGLKIRSQQKRDIPHNIYISMNSWIIMNPCRKNWITQPSN
jgi:hypothetical protein